MKIWKYCIVVVVLGTGFSACGPGRGQPEKAEQVLRSFFEALAQENYAAVDRYYGGSYDPLLAYNPALDPADTAALWRNACEINGFQCLEVRSVTFEERNEAGEYIFTVQFTEEGGALFTKGPCCGAEEGEQRSDFLFRVKQDPEGVFRVLDMPVYLP